MLAAFKVMSRIFIKVSKSLRKTQKIAEFSDRTECDAQEAQVFLFRLPGTALHDIRCHRYSATSQLVRQTVLLSRRKGMCGFLNCKGELIGEMKGLELSVVSHRSSLKPQASGLRPPPYRMVRPSDFNCSRASSASRVPGCS